MHCWKLRTSRSQTRSQGCAALNKRNNKTRTRNRLRRMDSSKFKGLPWPMHGTRMRAHGWGWEPRPLSLWWPIDQDKEQNGSICEAMGEPSKHTAGRSGRFEVSLPSLDVWKFKLCRHVCLCPVNREAEAHRVEEYNAAVTIQSWFRGCRLRTHLKWVIYDMYERNRIKWAIWCNLVRLTI